MELYYGGKPWAEIIKPIETFQNIESDKVKTKENLLTLMQLYINNYAEQDKSWKILGIELKDSIVIQDIIYIVKVDLIIEDRGNIYVVDHKTAGIKKKWNYFTNFEPNTQVTGYTAYCQGKFGQCSGFIPNACFVGHRERKYKGEEAGFHVDFDRTIINRYPQQIEDFKVNIIDVVSQIENCKITGYWSKTEGNCGYCQFKELCI
jgi:hypothetical protein